MRWAVALATVVGLAAATMPAAGAPTATGFRFGVAVGEITSTSAVFWTRTPNAKGF